MWVYRMSSGHLIIPQSPFSGPPTLYTGGQSPKGHGGATCNLILLLIYVRSKISQAFITALMRPTICRLYEKSSVHNQFTWAVLDQIIERVANSKLFKHYPKAMPRSSGLKEHMTKRQGTSLFTSNVMHGVVLRYQGKIKSGCHSDQRG